MNKRIDLTLLDGLCTYQDTLDFMQMSYRGAFAALATALGSKLILHGVQNNNGVISDGWVIIDGELMPFAGGPLAEKVIIEELKDQELFADNSLKDVYFTRRAVMGVVGGFPFSELRSFKTDSVAVDDSNVLASAKALKKIADQVLGLIGLESEVILSGCEVSNVGANTLSIAAGVVKIDGDIIDAPAYNGQFPVYLQPDATYTTVAPVGPSISFDPYTSQYYVDVFRRATTKPGQVIMFRTNPNRFDNAGLGKWEFKGFRICDEMGGRVPVGYDRRNVNPNDGVWDAAYNGVGNTGGAKTVGLTKPQLPAVKINVPIPASKTSTTHNGTGRIAGGGEGPEPGSLQSLQTDDLGDGEGHENRQPFRVVMFLERIQP